MSDATRHIPVMRDQVVDALQAKKGGRFLDCTLGGAGHAAAILDANPGNFVVGCDRDRRALDRARGRLRSFEGRFSLLHSRFSTLSSVLDNERFDGVLADLGVSTDQLFEDRGFSFNDRAPLDMRMDESAPRSADDVVNRTSVGELRLILQRGGVGAEASLLARAIARARPVGDTGALAAVIAGAMPRSRIKKGIHPATVAFQAIRMAVNGEQQEIECLMAAVPDYIRPSGRLAVLTFHSIEDKLVMRAMRYWEQGDSIPANWPGSSVQASKKLGRVLTRKAVLAGKAEVEFNPAARSARLRVFEFSA